jgi:Zn-finger nucleic acid-binding protein
MEAQTLNCPMCGAAASTDSTRCEHCGARLATVACPKCFGMMFVGAKFCSHCGAAADRTDLSDDVVEPCPRCRVNTKAIVIGKTELRECPRCEGLWVDAEALQQICTDRERQAAVLGVATPMPASDAASTEKVSYLPCPVCRKLMNRVNFAHCSNVIVDVCRQHGTWFDRDELRRIVEFIQGGGLEKAREKEIARLEEQRRQLAAARIADAGRSGSGYSSLDYDPRGVGIAGAAAAVLSSFFD